jgi:DNA-binding FadR family transcriptional regulator
MRSVASVIEAALVASFSYSSPVDDAENQDVTVQSHAAIVNAIEARDAQAAADAMLEVIDVGVRRIDATKKKRGSKR